MHQERGEDEVEAAIFERYLLRGTFDQLHPRRPADQAPRFAEIGRAEIEAAELHAGPGFVHGGEQAAGAAADIETTHVALIAAGHPVGDGLQCPAAHHVGSAGEQHLDLRVVEGGRMFGEPTVGLEVKVLPVIGRQSVALLAGRQFLIEAPMTARVDLRQVAEIEEAAAQEFRRLGRQRARRGEQPVRDVAPFALEDRAHVGGHLLAVRCRSDGIVGLGHRLQNSPARRIMTGIPGDARRLAGGVGQSIESGHHYIQGLQEIISCLRETCPVKVGGYSRAPCSGALMPFDQERRPGPGGGAHERAINLPPAILWLIVINLAVQGIRLLLSEAVDDNLILQFGLVPANYTTDTGVGWLSLIGAPIAYQFLHGGWVHVGVNMLSLAAFGAPVERILGPRRFVLFYLSAGIVAGVVHVLIYGDSVDPVVGASGAISGVFGAVLILMRRGGSLTSLLPVAGVWIALNIFFGLTDLTPGAQGEPVAWIAHIAGFIYGLAAIRLFLPRPPVLS